MRSSGRLFLPPLGAMAIGAASFVNFVAFGARGHLLAGTLVLAGVTAWVGIATFRKVREFAWGWLGGYAVLTLMSGGTCTLFTDASGANEELLLVGFFGYPVLGVLYLLITTVWAIVRSLRRR